MNLTVPPANPEAQTVNIEIVTINPARPIAITRIRKRPLEHLLQFEFMFVELSLHVLQAGLIEQSDEFLKK